MFDPQILKYAALPAAVVGVGSFRIYSVGDRKSEELISPKVVRRQTMFRIVYYIRLWAVCIRCAVQFAVYKTLAFSNMCSMQ